MIFAPGYLTNLIQPPFSRSHWEGQVKTARGSKSVWGAGGSLLYSESGRTYRDDGRVCICAVLSSNHWTQSDTEHLRCDQCDWELEFYFCFISAHCNVSVAGG